MQKEDNDDEYFEGPRVFRLKGAMNQTVDKIISELSWEKFLSCFPTEFVEENKKVIYESYVSAFSSLFGENVKSEFKIICEEINLRKKLNELDTSILDLSDEKFSTGNDETNDLTGIVDSVGNKEKLVNEMNDLLSKLKIESKKQQKENETLTSKLQEASDLIQNQMEKLEETIETINEWDELE
eukprot:gene9349-1436_t